MSKELRKKVIELTATLALGDTEKTGEDYKTAISKALEESCKRLDISNKEFIKMFI
jgi:hypothetical protein